MTRDFHVTLTYEGGSQGFTERFADSADAVLAGLDRIGERPGPIAVRVRPAVEWTYSEGRMRWPNALHPQAFTEAFLGWSDRAAEARKVEAAFGELTECAA